MEVAVPLVVGGLAGFSVATACGAEPRVPQVPPAELARQALETVAEKLPRELVENDLLKKDRPFVGIAGSGASLWPRDRGCFGAFGVSAAIERCLLRFTNDGVVIAPRICLGTCCSDCRWRRSGWL